MDNDKLAIITILIENSRKRNELLLQRSSLSGEMLERIVEIFTDDTIERCKGYYEDVIPQLRFSTFKSHFRMSPVTFEILLAELANTPEVQKKNGNIRGGRPQIKLEKMLLIALWTLATTDSYSSIADRFDVTQSSVYKTLNTIIKAINNNLCKLFVRLPNEDEKLECARIFSTYGLQSVVGAIHACHIPIKPPKENGNDYYNKKKFYSIVLQGICSKNLKFIDVDVSWPGSVNDARIFRTSDIFGRGPEFCNANYYIIGDAAYPCLPWLMCPFQNNGQLRDEQIHFNKMLSKTRVVIENAFSLLKGRFRRIRDCLDRNNVQIIADTIIACSVVHNICLFYNDGDINQFIEEGRARSLEDTIEHGNQNFVEIEGFRRREEIVQELWRLERDNHH